MISWESFYLNFLCMYVLKQKLAWSSKPKIVILVFPFRFYLLSDRTLTYHYPALTGTFIINIDDHMDHLYKKIFQYWYKTLKVETINVIKQWYYFLKPSIQGIIKAVENTSLFPPKNSIFLRYDIVIKNQKQLPSQFN